MLCLHSNFRLFCFMNCEVWIFTYVLHSQSFVLYFRRMGHLVHECLSTVLFVLTGHNSVSFFSQKRCFLLQNRIVLKLNSLKHTEKINFCVLMRNVDKFKTSLFLNFSKFSQWIVTTYYFIFLRRMGYDRTRISQP